MLLSGAQVIVRWQEVATFRCESFDGLAIQNPALVILAHCGTLTARHDMDELHSILIAELLALGAKQQSSPPCGLGSGGQVTGCHAENESDCQKLLVMVSDGANTFADQPSFAPWKAAAGAYTVLPLASATAKCHFSSLFPSWVGAYNATFWSASPAEGVPAVLGLAGITAELPKIFISYRQAESASLAIQIFDALSHAGFDVFLDHFRIPPGVNFQARLTQELGDKSMVLFLESNTFLQSPWVTYEVNVAKTCSLGIHALNLCSAPPIPGVDEAVRTRLLPADFVEGSLVPSSTLTAAKVDEVVALVRREHDRAIVRRRKILEAALEGAILRAGGALPVPIGSGAFQIDSLSGGKSYVVALTPRPPDLPDFHQVYGKISHPTVGVVMGLSRLMEPALHQRLSWLAGISALRFRDEGEMLALARQMIEGSL